MVKGCTYRDFKAPECIRKANNLKRKQQEVKMQVRSKCLLLSLPSVQNDICDFAVQSVAHFAAFQFSWKCGKCVVLIQIDVEKVKRQRVLKNGGKCIEKLGI